MQIKTKFEMWNKVTKLSGKGLSKSQISRKTGLSRPTVYSYLSKGLDSFDNNGSLRKKYRKKLDPYEKFIKEQLEDVGTLSASQIRDRLLEYYPDMPPVDDKTVYNFVTYVRTKYNIAKEDLYDARDYQQIIQSPYGEDAQVDFGEGYMCKADGSGQIKVYFFAMVFCRSRQKFIYYQRTPFTAETAVWAHHLAFEFYGGMPQRCIYDQDKVFIVNENIGDLLLTRIFKQYITSIGLKTLFCRKSDPESKGKVENVVKFVKQNFMHGRKFIDIETLNSDAHAWLQRTGNGHVHAATKLIPSEEFAIEKDFLRTYYFKMNTPEQQPKIYVIRKDNTMAYKGNFYTVPLGSYNKYKGRAMVELEGTRVRIYTVGGALLADHELELRKGILVQNNNHLREYSTTLEELEQQALKKLEHTDQCTLYLSILRRNYGRYYRDHLKIINVIECKNDILNEALNLCMSTREYSAASLREVVSTLSKRTKSVIIQERNVPYVPSERDCEMIIDRSSIQTYQDILL